MKLIKCLLNERNGHELGLKMAMNMIGQEEGVEDISLLRNQCLKRHEV